MQKIDTELSINYKILKSNKLLKKDIENSFDLLKTYKNDEIVEVLNYLMSLNLIIKDTSHNINSLLNKKSNIINKYNKNIVKKCPTNGEQIIIDHLNKLKLQDCIFYYEYDKVLPIKFKNNLRADFFIIDKHYNYFIIEYDGIQNNNFTPFFNTNSSNFYKYKLRDSIKNKYCKDNNIKLVRIDYKLNTKQINKIIIDTFNL